MTPGCWLGPQVGSGGTTELNEGVRNVGSEELGLRCLWGPMGVDEGSILPEASSLKLGRVMEAPLNPTVLGGDHLGPGEE